MTPSRGKPPKLTLKGREAETLKLRNADSKRADEPPAGQQHRAYTELVLAHEKLNAPQFGRKFTRIDDGRDGAPSGGFRVVMRPRPRGQRDR